MYKIQLTNSQENKRIYKANKNEKLWKNKINIKSAASFQFIILNTWTLNFFRLFQKCYN